MITEQNYHTETTHISKSGLDKINISPAHYYYYYIAPESKILEKRQSKDLLIGEVFHALLMEPHFFYSRYFVTPEKIDRRTKEGSSLWFKCAKAAKGKKVINKDIYELALWMLKSVQSNPIAKHLFSAGKAEQIFTFTEPNTGVKCKIKPDWITPTGYILDLKSANDASCLLDEGLTTSNQYIGFPKSVFNFRYDVQAAFYSDGYTLATGKTPKGFIFVAVEKNPPYQLSLYQVNNEILDAARQKYINNLETYARCKKTGVWPGYPQKIITITPPL